MVNFVLYLTFGCVCAPHTRDPALKLRKGAANCFAFRAHDECQAPVPFDTLRFLPLRLPLRRIMRRYRCTLDR